MSKRIFVLYTGGTIGMVPGADGLMPDEGLAQMLMPSANGMIFDWYICRPLIDSSAVRLEDWKTWLELVRSKLVEYDGILILHGTDTLAYTANLFALALPDVDKPIVLTGAQLPFHAPQSDAPLNVQTAAAVFTLPDVRGVWIAFGRRLLQAVGSSKVSTEHARGFDNPHFGAAAVWQHGAWQLCGGSGGFLSENAADNLPRSLRPSADTAVYTLVPGMMQHYIAQDLRRKTARAVVLQSYGHGNTPDDEAFISAVRQFAESGGILLNISQSVQGRAAAVYEQGSALRQAGAVQGGKCNLETASVLAVLAAGNAWTADDMRCELLRLNLL
ncbi:MAG: asparaginase [Neisseria sp.]|nr:asparaginase [Neisseria sp.]